MRPDIGFALWPLTYTGLPITRIPSAPARFFEIVISKSQESSWHCFGHVSRQFQSIAFGTAEDPSGTEQSRNDVKNAHYLEGISDIPEHVRADNEIDLSHEIGGTEAIHDLNALPILSMERQVTRAHTSDARCSQKPAGNEDLANTGSVCTIGNGSPADHS